MITDGDVKFIGQMNNFPQNIFLDVNLDDMTDDEYWNEVENEDSD